MESIAKENILKQTQYGLKIYSYILRRYYPGEIVLSISGMQVNQTKNPFNDNRYTLQITFSDGIFIFRDTELHNFKGDPFDFAKLYFNTNGYDLLLRIIKDLNLVSHNIEDSRRLNKSESIAGYSTINTELPMFSFFRAPISNIYPTKEINIINTYEMIINNSYILRTMNLREESNSSTAKKIKAQKFDYVIFSGCFSKRMNNAIIKKSGLIVFDFDHIQDLEGLKRNLLQDEYFETELMFISPSGNGLKWIISIDNTKASHQDYFTAISNYLSYTYSIEADKSGKDISRACFLPYDPEAYINPKYLKNDIKKRI